MNKEQDGLVWSNSNCNSKCNSNCSIISLATHVQFNAESMKYCGSRLTLSSRSPSADMLASRDLGSIALMRCVLLLSA